jgi:hypothetical protein
MTTSVLPVNSSNFEKGLDDALDLQATFTGPIDEIANLKTARPIPDGFGPFLVWEEGLGKISKFFNTYAEILDNGFIWREQRETPQGVMTALSWIGYVSPVLEDQNLGRLKWNRYQIDMGQLPSDPEVEGLNDAEYLADISDNVRDVFFRGYHGYDVRPLITSGGKASHNLASGISGVTVEGGSTIWSHGDSHSISGTATATERQTLGVDYVQGQAITWTNIPWNAPGISWSGIQDVSAFKAWSILRRDAYIVFFDALDEVIGARRVGTWKSLVSESGDNATIKFECRTGFGDGSGKTVASCGVLFFASNADATKPGRQWLEPEEISISDGLTVLEATAGKTAFSLGLRETIRVKLEFDLTI